MKYVRRLIKYKHLVMLILIVHIVYFSVDEQHNEIIIDNVLVHDYHASIFFFISLFFWFFVYYLLIKFSRYYRSSKHQLENDSLTELKNRIFLQGADYRIKKDVRAQGFNSIGVIVLDIDYFKQINDSLGHNTGDLVLIRVGQILKGNVRTFDECYRVGGDEFILIIKAHRNVELIELVNRLQNSIEQDRYLCEVCFHPVTVSGGFIRLEPNELVHNAILKADNFLYIAKRTGRGHIHYEC